MHWVNVSLYEYPLHWKKQHINNLPVASLVENNEFHFKIILIPYLEYLLIAFFLQLLESSTPCFPYTIAVAAAFFSSNLGS